VGISRWSMLQVAVLVLAGACLAPAGELPTSPSPAEEAPSVAPSLEPSPLPSPVSGRVTPHVVGTLPVEALAPRALVSFAAGELVSISPDGRYALTWQSPQEMLLTDRVRIVAVPLDGSEPIELGIGGWEPNPKIPGDSVIRLARPAWSVDGSAVAFETGRLGTVAYLDGRPSLSFAVEPPDAPITALAEGGFVVQTPDGPRVIGGPGRLTVSVPPDLGPPIVFFPDGAALVGVTEDGDLVWTDGTRRLVVAHAVDPNYASDPFHRWALYVQNGSYLVFVQERLRPAVPQLVAAGGSSWALERHDDWCGRPAVSDDGKLLAVTVCDRTGRAEGYAIRLVRLADGAALDIGSSVEEPAFFPGSRRLASLALGHDSPVNPTLTLWVATVEVEP
jgi:hypothetical protein